MIDRGIHVPQAAAAQGVLIVGEDPQLETLPRALRDAGISVRRADSHDDATAQVRAHVPRLMVLLGACARADIVELCDAVAEVPGPIVEMFALTRSPLSPEMRVRQRATTLDPDLGVEKIAALVVGVLQWTDTRTTEGRPLTLARRVEALGHMLELELSTGRRSRPPPGPRMSSPPPPLSGRNQMSGKVPRPAVDLAASIDRLDPRTSEESVAMLADSGFAELPGAHDRATPTAFESAFEAVPEVALRSGDGLDDGLEGAPGATGEGADASVAEAGGEVPDTDDPGAADMGDDARDGSSEASASGEPEGPPEDQALARAGAPRKRRRRARGAVQAHPSSKSERPDWWARGFGLAALVASLVVLWNQRQPDESAQARRLEDRVLAASEPVPLEPEAVAFVGAEPTPSGEEVQAPLPAAAEGPAEPAADEAAALAEEASAGQAVVSVEVPQAARAPQAAAVTDPGAREPAEQLAGAPSQEGSAAGTDPAADTQAAPANPAAAADDDAPAPGERHAQAAALVDEGIYYQRKGNHRMAAERFRAAVEVMPTYRRALLALVRVSLQLTDRGEAVTWAKQLVARYPAPALHHRLLGDALARAGDRTAARAAWQAAADSGDEAARARLED